MKFYSIILLSFGFICIKGCKERDDLVILKETGEQIQLDSTSTTSFPVAQKKNVLIEDYTGVKCVNCPTAQKILSQIIDKYPENVIGESVSVTSGFANPYPKSKESYRLTDYEGTLYSIVGNITQLPTGAIDRKMYSGNTSLQVDYTKWDSYTNQRLAEKTPVNITFKESKYIDTSAKVKVQVRIVFNEAVNAPCYFSSAILESGIIDVQLTPTGIDSHYVFNHLCRKVIQPYAGFKLGESFKKGATYVLSYAVKTGTTWNTSKLDVIGFVHHHSSPDEEILQAAEKHVE